MDKANYNIHQYEKSCNDNTNNDRWTIIERELDWCLGFFFFFWRLSFLLSLVSLRYKATFHRKPKDVRVFGCTFMSTSRMVDVPPCSEYSSCSDTLGCSCCKDSSLLFCVDFSLVVFSAVTLSSIFFGYRLSFESVPVPCKTNVSIATLFSGKGW